MKFICGLLAFIYRHKTLVFYVSKLYIFQGLQQLFCCIWCL